MFIAPDSMHDGSRNLLKHLGLQLMGKTGCDMTFLATVDLLNRRMIVQQEGKGMKAC